MRGASDRLQRDRFSSAPRSCQTECLSANAASLVLQDDERSTTGSCACFALSADQTLVSFSAGLTTGGRGGPDEPKPPRGKEQDCRHDRDQRQSGIGLGHHRNGSFAMIRPGTMAEVTQVFHLAPSRLVCRDRVHRSAQR